MDAMTMPPGKSFEMDGSLFKEYGYTPIKTLHRRSSGVQIVLARCLRSDHEVVLKFKNSDPVGTEDQQNTTDSVQNEADILNNLDHAHIIQFIDFFKVKNTAVMVLEVALGGTLEALIRTNRKIRNDRAKKLTNQLADAIIYLHNQKVAHCDIKCENILLDGEKNNVKLSDFGFAEDASISSGDNNIWKGSLAFAPPEGIAGLSHDPLAGDVWSFGVVVFHMVTGYLPFVGQGVTDILERTGEPLRWPRPLRSVDSICREFVGKVLERDGAKRPTMEEIKYQSWLL